MTACPQCDAPVLAAVDHLTREQVFLDRVPVQGGPVEVKRVPLMPGALIAVDHITAPAPRQPAFELHARTCPLPAPAQPVDLDDDPVREQSGGWRR